MTYLPPIVTMATTDLLGSRWAFIHQNKRSCTSMSNSLLHPRRTVLLLFDSPLQTVHTVRCGDLSLPLCCITTLSCQVKVTHTDKRNLLV